MTRNKTFLGVSLRVAALTWLVPAATGAQTVAAPQPDAPSEAIQTPPSAEQTPLSQPTTELPPGAPPSAPALPPSSAPMQGHAMPMMMGGHHHSLWGDERYRSPGLAFALSLTPLPVDFGNLYAENLGWGIVYTGIELGLGTGMMLIGADHMCHSRDCDRWTGSETGFMIGFVAAYVAVKFVAGIQAGAAARSFNQVRIPSVGIAPSAGGATFLLRATL